MVHSYARRRSNVLLTRLQHAAVDITCQDRRHVACDHRDHRFVQQRDTFRDVSEANEGAPASVTRQRRQITIAKAASDFGGLAECRVACCRVALHDALNGGGNQQISAHDAVELRLVEDTCSSGEPAGRRSDGAALQESKGKPPCGSGGPFVVASVDECLMRARSEGLALVIPAQEIGGRRDSFEVFRFQGSITVSSVSRVDASRTTPVARKTSAHAAMSRGPSCHPFRER